MGLQARLSERIKDVRAAIVTVPSAEAWKRCLPVSRSLWPPVLLHWSAVLIWITLLGGQGLVGTPAQSLR
jgi:predicted Abi (CAAX) family protease